MFGKSFGEILEIIGVILSITIIIFGSVWGLLESLNTDLTDFFNNITYPS